MLVNFYLVYIEVYKKLFDLGVATERMWFGRCETKDNGIQKGFYIGIRYI